MVKINKWYIPALLLAGGFIFNSCSEPDSLGYEVLPGSDHPIVGFDTTITIEAKTVREDSLRSDEAVAGFNLVGSYTDPVFGLSRASFYSQLRLPSNNTNFTFGVDPLLDSVVFTMAYADYYGDTINPINIEVYKTTEGMVIDSNFFTNDQLTVEPISLFNGPVSIRPKDSVLVSGAKRAPHLRLRLDNNFGTSFITSGNANFIDNTTFTTYFKGIHVKATDVTGTGQGAILSFNLLASMSKLTFYYKNGTDTTARAANFEINTGCPRFNRFEHDYTTSEFGNTFPVDGNNKLYIQSMAGLKIRFEFPNLKNFNLGGPVAINKAELVIPVLDNSTFKNHQNLLVFGVDSAGAEALIPDLLEATSYYGGAFSTTDNTYKFNIARYVQRIISGRIANDYGLSLISSGGAINAFRTIVPGTAATGSKMQLRITYSKLY